MEFEIFNVCGKYIFFCPISVQVFCSQTCLKCKFVGSCHRYSKLILCHAYGVGFPCRHLLVYQLFHLCSSSRLMAWESSRWAHVPVTTLETWKMLLAPAPELLGSTSGSHLETEPVNGRLFSVSPSNSDFQIKKVKVLHIHTHIYTHVSKVLSIKRITFSLTVNNVSQVLAGLIQYSISYWIFFECQRERMRERQRVRQSGNISSCITLLVHSPDVWNV